MWLYCIIEEYLKYEIKSEISPGWNVCFLSFGLVRRPCVVLSGPDLTRTADNSGPL